MPLTTTIQAVVFDFDGVILQSNHVKTAAFPALFPEYPEYHDQIVAHHIEHLGISRYVKFEWIYQNLLKLPLSKGESRRLGERFTEIVYQKLLEVDFVPGVLALLSELKERQVPMFVASGTPEEELIRIVQDRDLAGFFERVRGAPDTKVRIIGEIAEDFDLEPSEILFIGDGTTDFEAAQTLQLPFMAVDSPELAAFWQQQNLPAIQNLMSVKDYFRIG